jgi:heterodisulfide reductase subunit A
MAEETRKHESAPETATPDAAGIPQAAAGTAAVGAAMGSAGHRAQGAAPRVGVFICSCGEELSKVLDLPAVEADCRTIPGVVFASVEPYPCSRPGLAAVREVITENRLNRAVIAGCTPRLHGRLFADACEEAGLNRWLVDFANIREHCGRVHNDKAKATEKAKDLIRAAVSKVSRARPLDSIKICPLNSVLVIGGGISGLTVAAKLVLQGHEVTLAEKGDSLGGNLTKVPNVYPFNRAGSEIVQKAIAAIEGKVEILKNTTLSSLRGGPGQYAVTLSTGPSPAPRTDASSGDASGAAQGRASERSFGAIVVATGANWVKIKGLLLALQAAGPTACPTEDEYLSGATAFYGKLPAFTGRVLTQAEFESELAKGALKSVRSALFVNVLPGIHAAAVGTGFAGGRTSDTRLNSLVGLKNAIVFRHANPGTEVTFVFDRIPSEYERDFRRARDHGVKFVQRAGAEPLDFTLKGLRLRVRPAVGGGRAGEVSSAAGGPTPAAGNRAAVARLEHPGSQPSDMDTVHLEADLIVIPTIAVPSAETRQLTKILRIPMDSSGLFIEPHVKLRPGDFAERAIFVIGACHGPVTVFECLAQAGEAAARATRFLQSEVVRAPFVSHIDEKVCRGCSRCAEACEWDAIEMLALENGLKLAKVDETMCTGCGVCAMICICGAPTLAPVRSDQIKAMIGAMFG